jgi:HEAT repeat protein
MRTKLWILLMPAFLGGADLAKLQPLFDTKLTLTQRANACFDLRGDADPEVIRAMSRALEDPGLVSCAADNLRIIKAIEPLKNALASSNEQTRAAAARQLGSFQDAALLEPLSRVAQDVNVLVASNALVALSQYSDPAVIPYLVALAKKGGMIGDMALDRILQLDPRVALPVARKLLESPQVPDKLYAIRAIGAAGDRSDLPELVKIASSTEEIPTQHTRGFGLMPPINLARAAQSAIAQIEGEHRKGASSARFQ